MPTYSCLLIISIFLDCYLWACLGFLHVNLHWFYAFLQRNNMKAPLVSNHRRYYLRRSDEIVQVCQLEGPTKPRHCAKKYEDVTKQKPQFPQGITSKFFQDQLTRINSGERLCLFPKTRLDYALPRLTPKHMPSGPRRAFHCNVVEKWQDHGNVLRSTASRQQVS